MLKYLSDRLYHLVRGQGLVYSLSMSLSVSTGRVVLGMSKSAQLTGAYKAVREILNNYVQVSNSLKILKINSFMASRSKYRYFFHFNSAGCY